MAELKVEIEPTEAGFAPDRFARIDRRLARYVDEGRLPGWLPAGRRSACATTATVRSFANPTSSDATYRCPAGSRGRCRPGIPVIYEFVDERVERLTAGMCVLSALQGAMFGVVFMARPWIRHLGEGCQWSRSYATACRGW
jgi:hypothetical protein